MVRYSITKYCWQIDAAIVAWVVWLSCWNNFCLEFAWYSSCQRNFANIAIDTTTYKHHHLRLRKVCTYCGNSPKLIHIQCRSFVGNLFLTNYMWFFRVPTATSLFTYEPVELKMLMIVEADFFYQVDSLFHVVLKTIWRIVDDLNCQLQFLRQLNFVCPMVSFSSCVNWILYVRWSASVLATIKFCMYDGMFNCPICLIYTRCRVDILQFAAIFWLTMTLTRGLASIMDSLSLKFCNQSLGNLFI